MPLPEHLEYAEDAPEHQAGMVRPKQGANRCPECGIDLTEQSPQLHASVHWPARWDPNNMPSAEAVRRKKQLEGMTISQEHWSD